MAHLTTRAHEVLALQHGVIAVQQLHQAGVTARGIRHIEQTGGLVLALTGAYRTPSTPFDELARCAAVCLARQDLVISGPTAGRLWGFRRLPRDQRIHAIAPPASNPAIAPWVVPYRTSAIHDADVVTRPDGIRLTSRARTAFDLARLLGPVDLLSVIEQASHDGHLSDEDLYAVAVDWLSPQRPWARSFVTAVERRLSGAAAESHPEVIVGTALGHAGVRGLERQWCIVLPGYGRARFDLALPRLQWAIEVDVHPTHQQTDGRRSDIRRDDAARCTGWIVSRVSRDDYQHRFDARIDELTSIYADLRRAA